MKNTFIITILTLILVTTMPKDSEATDKIKVEDLDLDYFEQTIREQLHATEFWVGIMEKEMEKDGHVPEVKPSEELKKAVRALGKGDIKPFSEFARSYVKKVKERENYDDLCARIFLYANTLDRCSGGFGSYANVIGGETVRTIDNPVGRCAVRKKDGNHIEYVSDLEDIKKTKSTLINKTIETTGKFVREMGW